MPTPSPTWTPSPTITPFPTPIPLSKLIGFIDEHIELLEEYNYQLSKQTETARDGARYTAFLFSRTRASKNRLHYQTILLIYRFENNKPILVLDSRSGDLPGLWAVGEWLWHVEIQEWDDLNKDGNPDLVVHYSQGGTAWGINYQVHLWQISQSGEMVDLTASMYDELHLVPQRAIEDKDNDGVLELRVGDYRGEWYGLGHAGGVGSFKMYALDGDKIRDISTDYLALYDERIAQNIHLIQKTYTSSINQDKAIVITAKAFEILMDYENSDRLDEGWQIYWQLTEPTNWKNLSPEATKIIVHRREKHRSQYEKGEIIR